MSIVFGNKDHAQQIAIMSGCAYNPELDVVISRVTPEGYLLGGVIYQGFTHRTINAHIAGFVPNWISRDFLFVIFDYPFIQLGCESALVEIRSTNTKALDFVANMGFKIEARIRDVYPDGDLVIMRMYRDDCRFLKIKPRTLQRGTDGQKGL